LTSKAKDPRERATQFKRKAKPELLPLFGLGLA
jgi:hypothetical protein